MRKLSVEEINELKRKIPHGSIKRIAKMAKCHVSSVRYFMTGRNYNAEIHKALLDLIEELDEEFQILKERQQQILEKKSA